MIYYSDAMIFDNQIPNIQPFTFLENHISTFEFIYGETKGIIPVYKIGNKYFINRDKYVELYFAHHFEDGILLPNDIVSTVRDLTEFLKRNVVLKTYPIITHWKPYGYYVVINKEFFGPFRITTTNNKIALWIARKYFKNIKDIHEAYISPKNKK